MKLALALPPRGASRLDAPTVRRGCDLLEPARTRSRRGAHNLQAGLQSRPSKSWVAKRISLDALGPPSPSGVSALLGSGPQQVAFLDVGR